MGLIKCSECGNEIVGDAKVCPSCGFEIIQYDTSEDNTVITNKTVQKNKKYIGIVLCAIACVMFITAFTRINNDTYSFYKQHYEECMEGYAENKATANDYKGWFKNEYNYIASSYEDMAKADNKKIWKYRIQAIILCCGGGVCGVLGCGFIVRRKTNGISKMS